MIEKINQYKGIVLAGGEGTRLHPLTKVISKQLLPVYDMPMIFYPLKTLIKAGIKEILLITTEKQQNNYMNLLGKGEDFGIAIDYIVQNKPDGIAQAFDISREWLSTSPCVLILGDNLFLGGNVSELLVASMKKNRGSTIFGYKVKDSSRYGVVTLDKNNQVIGIEEKPKIPKSNWAVTGLYVYDNNVIDYVKDLKPSKRGELEITDLNNIYIKKNELDINFIDENSYWLDAGTKDSLLEASIIVENLKKKNIDLF